MNKATRTAKKAQAASEVKLLKGLRATNRQILKATRVLSDRHIARLEARRDELMRRIEGRNLDRLEDDLNTPVNYKLTELGLTFGEQIQEACKPFTVDSLGTVTR